MSPSTVLLPALYGLAVICVATTLATWSNATHWAIRIWDFPRVQQAGLALVLAPALVVVGGNAAAYVTAGLLALAGLNHLLRVLPYGPLWRVQLRFSASTPGSRSVSLLVVNVLMDNREADRLLEIIKGTNPDVVLAVEVDDWWTARLDSLADMYPHAVRHPLSNTYGVMLLARLPLVDPKIRFLLQDGIPSIRTGIRLRSGEVVRLYAIHPEPPSPTEADSSLGRDAELVMVGREIAQHREPSIVAGDLNDVGWSHTSRLFRRLSGLLDPRIGRGMFCTFNARWPLLRWPLDHVFVSADFLVRGMRRLPAFGSDHFPILIELDYAPQAEPLHDVPQAGPEDREEARETVAEAAAGLDSTDASIRA
jgi:endonuclease/exonuclease/phosphatase (EEP) superfamily protein YafD